MYGHLISYTIQNGTLQFAIYCALSVKSVLISYKIQHGTIYLTVTKCVNCVNRVMWIDYNMTLYYLLYTVYCHIIQYSMAL